MDYINEAVEYLINYKDLKMAFENLKDKEERLRFDLENLRAVNYDGMPKGNSVVSDDVLVNTIFKLQQTRVQFKETEDKIEKIDNVLKNLNQNESSKNYEEILRLWFIEEWPKQKMTLKFNCSERQLYRLKAKAIRKLAIQLFGINVIV